MAGRHSAIAELADRSSLLEAMLLNMLCKHMKIYENFSTALLGFEEPDRRNGHLGFERLLPFQLHPFLCGVAPKFGNVFFKVMLRLLVF